MLSGPTLFGPIIKATNEITSATPFRYARSWMCVCLLIRCYLRYSLFDKKSSFFVVGHFVCICCWFFLWPSICLHWLTFMICSKICKLLRYLFVKYPTCLLFTLLHCQSREPAVHDSADHHRWHDQRLGCDQGSNHRGVQWPHLYHHSGGGRCWLLANGCTGQRWTATVVQQEDSH